MKRKPTGFVAMCQCGETIGAMDLSRTDKREAGAILSKWLNDGCSVDPRFDGSWSVIVRPCKCETSTKGGE